MGNSADKLRLEIESTLGAVYVVDGQTNAIVYQNEQAKSCYGGDLTGRPCYEANHGLNYRCGYCPASLKEGRNYKTEFFDSVRNEWFKATFRSSVLDGRRCRIVRLENIDDVMGLNAEAIGQMAFLQNLLAENMRMKTLLEWDASHDRMTGLFNQSRFYQDIELIEGTQTADKRMYIDKRRIKSLSLAEPVQ